MTSRIGRNIAVHDTHDSLDYCFMAAEARVVVAVEVGKR